MSRLHRSILLFTCGSLLGPQLPHARAQMTTTAPRIQEVCTVGPEPSQVVTNAQCAPCRNCLHPVSSGCGQNYWPCTVAGLCQNQLGGACGTGTNPSGGLTAVATLPPATCGIAVRYVVL